MAHARHMQGICKDYQLSFDGDVITIQHLLNFDHNNGNHVWMLIDCRSGREVGEEGNGKRRGLKEKQVNKG